MPNPGAIALLVVDTCAGCLAQRLLQRESCISPGMVAMTLRCTKSPLHLQVPVWASFPPLQLCHILSSCSGEKWH